MSQLEAQEWNRGGLERKKMMQFLTFFYCMLRMENESNEMKSSIKLFYVHCYDVTHGTLCDDFISRSCTPDHPEKKRTAKTTILLQQPQVSLQVCASTRKLAWAIGVGWKLIITIPRQVQRYYGKASENFSVHDRSYQQISKDNLSLLTIT